MKDLYSFHTDEADLNRYYEIVKKAYFKIYERIGIGKETVLTFATGGNFSQFSHEFQTLNNGGEDTIYLCSKCRVAVNKEIIDTQKTCPECGNDKLEAVKATEVGNIFKLRTKFSNAFKFYYSDSKGQEKIVEMGCYGMGPSRVMGTVVELCHDDAGITWPKNIAPYQVHLISLDGLGEDLYQELLSKNIDVLFDDREVSAGTKFADADLIGIPLRLVISKRSQEKGGIEYKLRSQKESEIIKPEDLVSKIIKFYN
jgi:prolyl-tRNA synthetase